ncbi:MAG TPA: serine/threonine-protein kinase [Thermoanaerobaculia bacterium]|nr:serine/threonine-protein kinase [Thermoanaerobaculia bacterium]
MSSPPTPLDPSRLTTADGGVLPALGLATLTERPGAVIDRYTLLEEIGSGGFGSVFLAEQREPVARQVALKVLKLGMDTRQVIARFEQERQALALMDHPHIAKVLDAGSTDAGRPYFVMELVTGEPITGFCDAHGLSLDQRLELFVQVCNAIQHAHQKGIIHRDIKPSNVLVSMHDAEPHAKVIDFGIAKAIEQPLGGETMHTRLGQFVGTPLYMSPEQSEVGVEVDTRSDVYSLGVLLYELLTGTTPFAPEGSDTTSMSELQRLIREVDPPRPSTRVSTATGTLPRLAAARSTEPRRLLSLLRGELDWVAMKAIEKEPERRYQTANALAHDVQRYLAGEPVVAAPPSATYRLRKFVTRNKGPVVAAAVVALALIGGLAGTLWQSRVAAGERDVARKEAARATALNDFMTQMLQASNPEVQGSHDVTVVEVLAKASETADKTLASEPDAEAEARLLLGETFRSLGKTDEAMVELGRAVALRERGAGDDQVAYSRTLRALALAHRDRGELDEALSLYQRSLSLLASRNDAEIAEQVTAEYELALVLSRASRFAEAEQHLEASDGLLDRLADESPVKRAQILSARSVLAENWKGDLDAAERLSAAALELQRRGSERYLITDALNNLALIKNSRGKYDEAIPLYEEAIALNKEIYGDRHPVVAVNLENLGNVYMRRGEYDTTLALLDEVLSIRESALGPDSLPAARTRFNMGVVASYSGDFARAFTLLDAGLAIFRREYGERTVEAAVGFFYRGSSNEGLGRFDAALRDYESSLAILDALGSSPTEVMRLNAVESLSRLRCRQGVAMDRARGAVEQVLAALDRGNSDHQTWIERFEKLRESCAAR